MSLYTSENPVFATFSFYAALLGAKTLTMAFLTARQRYSKRVSNDFSFPPFEIENNTVVILFQGFC